MNDAEENKVDYVPAKREEPGAQENVDRDGDGTAEKVKCEDQGELDKEDKGEESVHGKMSQEERTDDEKSSHVSKPKKLKMPVGKWQDDDYEKFVATIFFLNPGFRCAADVGPCETFDDEGVKKLLQKFKKAVGSQKITPFDGDVKVTEKELRRFLSETLHIIKLCLRFACAERGYEYKSDNLTVKPISSVWGDGIDPMAELKTLKAILGVMRKPLMKNTVEGQESRFWDEADAIFEKVLPALETFDSKTLSENRITRCMNSIHWRIVLGLPQYSTSIFDNKQCFNFSDKMTANLNDDSVKINGFILNAAINKDPVFDAFKKLCEIQNNQMIDYVDFEWKYFQFFHGNRDLTIERSPQNSSSLTFSDLPMDVLKKIVEKCALADRLALRKVSPDPDLSLRKLVDSTKIECEYVAFDFSRVSCKIQFEEVDLDYKKTTDNLCHVSSSYPKRSKEYKVDRNFQQVMIADVSTFLKNPQLKIDEIAFVAYNEKGLEDVSLDSSKLLRKSFNSQLNARYFYVRDCQAEAILLLLQCLKPQRLEVIHLDLDDWTADQFKEIVETEHWKMARKFQWGTSIFPYEFQMENLLHFKEIQIDNIALTDKNLIMLRDVLLKSTHLEVCSLRDWTDEFGPESDMRKVDGIMSQDPTYDSETRRFSIQGSRDYFQLVFERPDEVLLTFTRVYGN